MEGPNASEHRKTEEDRQEPDILEGLREASVLQSKHVECIYACVLPGNKVHRQHTDQGNN